VPVAGIRYTNVRLRKHAQYLDVGRFIRCFQQLGNTPVSLCLYAVYEHFVVKLPLYFVFLNMTVNSKFFQNSPSVIT